MGEPLLPTPRAQMGSTEQPSALRKHKGGGRPRRLEVEIGRTSASSPGSEGSTSPSTDSDTDVSARSSGTPTARQSSLDTGPTFPDGETSPGSPLLPTPMAGTNRKSEKAMRSSAADGGNGRRSGGGNSSPPGLEQQIEALLPTPSANQYESQSAETIAARREREAAKGRNGNGFGLTTAMALTMLQAGEDPTSSAEGSLASPPPSPADAKAAQMTAGSGPSSPVSLASYDPATSSWRTYQGSLLSMEDERFPRSWERWPTSGMTRRGRAYALPMWVRPTAESASSWLQTPSAADAMGGHLSRGGDRSDELLLKGQVKSLLPTPRREGFDAGNHRGQPDSLNQTVRQLPTPKTSDANGSKPHGDGGPGLKETLRSLGDPTNQPSEDGSE